MAGSLSPPHSLSPDPTEATLMTRGAPRQAPGEQHHRTPAQAPTTTSTVATVLISAPTYRCLLHSRPCTKCCNIYTTSLNPFHLVRQVLFFSHCEKSRP